MRYYPARESAPPERSRILQLDKKRSRFREAETRAALRADESSLRAHTSRAPSAN